MKIIVGLGNPGDKYKNTRHNAGFMVLDELAKQAELTWQKNKKFNAFLAKDQNTIYIKPLTFMNNSGAAVGAILSYYKLLPKKFGLVAKRGSDLSSLLTIIHDEIDLPLGRYKISADSGSAGHKGVSSIIDRLKTKNFTRIRIGIKNEKPAEMPTEKYVLASFSLAELSVINNLIPEIIQQIPR